MRAFHWLLEEGASVLTATIYFGAWFFVIIILKHLMLEGYSIEFND